MGPGSDEARNLAVDESLIWLPILTSPRSGDRLNRNPSRNTPPLNRLPAIAPLKTTSKPDSNRSFEIANKDLRKPLEMVLGMGLERL
jgi:hypothetical protein